MELKRKYLAGAVLKDGTLGDRQIRVVVSTPAPDRVKDVMDPAGCDLSNYLRNPIVLADHNTKTAIGTAVPEITPDRVQALITFAPAGISAKADEYCGLAKAGILTTVSPGFTELEVAPLPGGGLNIKRWELLEISLVAVPAQPEAIVTARSLEQAGANWKVGASRNLPVSAVKGWNDDGASEGIFEKAEFGAFGDGNPDTTFARKGFLIYDAGNAGETKSYRIPFAKLIDGRLTVTPESIAGANTALKQLDLPDDVAEKARAVLTHYEGEMKKDKAITATKAIKIKSLYDVAQLAYLLQELGYIQSCAIWEADYEGDESNVPALLLEAMREAGNALVAMTLEEIGELLGEEIIVEASKGLSVETLGKIKALKSPIAKAFAIARAKAGRKFSAATQKSMEDACKSILGGHDAIKSLLNDVDPDTDIDPDDADAIAETDTGKALPPGVMSDREREVELLRLKGLG